MASVWLPVSPNHKPELVVCIYSVAQTVSFLGGSQSSSLVFRLFVLCGGVHIYPTKEATFSRGTEDSPV